MKPEQRRLAKLRAGGYRNDKNPRKAKKAMKKVVIESVIRTGNSTLKELKCRVHWVPGSGWTVTIPRKRKPLTSSAVE